MAYHNCVPKPELPKGCAGFLYVDFSGVVKSRLASPLKRNERHGGIRIHYPEPIWLQSLTFFYIRLVPNH